MKKLAILLLINTLLNHTNLLAQVVSVPAEWCGTSGTLTTTSIIKNGARINEGPYSYIGTRVPQEGYSKGTLSVKTSKLNYKFDGNFLMTYLGGHFVGELDFKMDGKLNQDTLIGLWKIKSKCRNIDAYNNSLFTFDMYYELNFNEKGQLISGVRTNNSTGSIHKFQTDARGQMHGLYTVKYKENGFEQEDIEKYIHGVKVSKYTKDIKTGAILGKIELLADTNIVREELYNEKENGFLSPNYQNLNTKIKNANDSLDWLKTKSAMFNSKEYENYFNLLTKIETTEALIKNSEMSKNSFLKQMNNYSKKKNGELLYAFLENKKVLRVNSKTEKEMQKVLSTLSNSENEEDQNQVYFVQDRDSILAIKINSDGGFNKIIADKKTEKSILKMFEEGVIIVDSDQIACRLKHTGIDAKYFLLQEKTDSIALKIDSDMKSLEESKKEALQYHKLEETVNLFVKKSEYYSNEIKSNTKALEKEKKYLKLNFEKEAFKYFFTEKNEMGHVFGCLEINFKYKLPVINKLAN